MSSDVESDRGSSLLASDAEATIDNVALDDNHAEVSDASAENQEISKSCSYQGLSPH